MRSRRSHRYPVAPVRHGELTHFEPGICALQGLRHLRRE